MSQNTAQNIALVDDDRNIITSVSMSLEAEGFNVKTYNDGEEGLKGITDTPPDLVAVSYTHLRAHETREDLVCRLLLEKKK